ncbi:MAG: type IV secretion system DNA-binding domain-containing protein [Oscillospiraceae bacterium]|nr:type IV secretion system DNA-binding domain-containing protein [Oscillospiraceae bacterium]
MKKIEVFDGNELLETPILYPTTDPNCAFIGVDKFGKDVYVPVDANLLSRHMMLLGGIGTGKTNTFNQIISQLRSSMTKDDVMIIFDTKGDFYNTFYRPGDIVISNDHTATGPNGKDYWNVFNEIEHDEHMEENIVEIAKSLFHQKLEKTNQPFFPNAAKDLFSAILTHFTRHPELKANNKTLRAFLDGSPTAEIREMLKQHDDLKAMVSYIFDDRSPQTQGVISELQQLSREIFLGNFKQEGTLSMRNIVRNKGGKFVFIEYDLGIGSMLSPIYSLLFDLAIKEALCRKKSEGSVYFITDEFSLIPNLQHVDDAVNFGRSLGVKFMIGIQNIDQVYENYGENRARSLLSGFLTSICFRVNDGKSKEYIRELHGVNRKKEIYMASVQGRGIVESLRDANVVEDWDITRLGIGQAIIGFPGKPPFIFQFKKV